MPACPAPAWPAPACSAPACSAPPCSAPASRRSPASAPLADTAERGRCGGDVAHSSCRTTAAQSAEMQKAAPRIAPRVERGWISREPSRISGRERQERLAQSAFSSVRCTMVRLACNLPVFLVGVPRPGRRFLYSSDGLHAAQSSLYQRLWSLSSRAGARSSEGPPVGLERLLRRLERVLRDEEVVGIPGGVSVAGGARPRAC